MKVKALRSFSGAVNMSRGQVMDIQDDFVLNDLLKAGYVEALEEANTQMDADDESDGGEPDTEETLTGTLDTEELQAMHKNDLKKLAEDMGIDASGTQDELVARIAKARVEAGVVE